jgi:hypothetical protein
LQHALVHARRPVLQILLEVELAQLRTRELRRLPVALDELALNDRLVRVRLRAGPGGQKRQH